MEQVNEELKNKIESLLFSAGKKIELAEIAKLCSMSHNVELVEKSLKKLKEKYSEGPIMLVQEDTAWKMAIREKYISIVQKIVTRTELSKTLMETLAVIAYKAPVLQSDVIKTRTNKAYDHLMELEKQGYISREKHGRTKMIRLSPKFFDYFDIPPEKVKERFQQIKEMEKAVILKGAEAKELKKMVKEKDAEHKQRSDEEKKDAAEELNIVESEIIDKEKKLPEIDLVDDEGHEEKLDVYDSEVAEGTEFEEPKANIIVIREELGDLEIIKPGLSEQEKKEIISEAERLKKADIAFEKEKKGSATRETEFKEKFTIFKKESTEEAPEENEAPEGEEEPEVPEEGEVLEEESEEAPEEDEVPEEEAEETEKPKKKSKVYAGEKKKEPEPPKKHATADEIAAEAKEMAKKKPINFKEGKKLFEKGIPKDVEAQIDQKVEEIVYGKKPQPESKENENKNESDESDESDGAEEKEENSNQKETRDDY